MKINYLYIKNIHMAKAEKLMAFIHKWEGGFANNPNDGFRNF